MMKSSEIDAGVTFPPIGGKEGIYTEQSRGMGAGLLQESSLHPMPTGRQARPLPLQNGGRAEQERGLPISVVIITKNEQEKIADCITSVAFAEEVIVIDAHSTDSTAHLAERMGARVITREWDGYGAQKNYGAQQARNNWVLFLDADERVSPELTSAISGVLQTTCAVYWVTIQDIFLEKKLKHMVGHNPRLIQKHLAHWNDAHVHEKMMYLDTNTEARYKDGISGEITAPIIHLSYTSISAYLTKMHKYTTLDAQEMQKTGKHRSGKLVTKNFSLPYHLAIKQFVKLSFYRKGILDGWQGIVWCALSAYYEFEMGQKYLYPSRY